MTYDLHGQWDFGKSQGLPYHHIRDLMNLMNLNRQLVDFPWLPKWRLPPVAHQPNRNRDIVIHDYKGWREYHTGKSILVVVGTLTLCEPGCGQQNLLWTTTLR